MYGILTYHDGYNFGTFLQVYSLQEKIRELGHDVCVLNYKNWNFFFMEYRALLLTKRPNIFFGNLGKAWKFRQEHNLLKLTSRFMNAEKLRRFPLEGIIYGSDEIWNYSNPAIGGLDTVYFGQGFTGRKISYAPSFGTLPIDKPLLPEVRQLLYSFCTVSVRDVHSQNLLKKNCEIHAPLVIDPTLLYDLNGKEHNCPHEKFILVYTTGFPLEVQKELVSYAKKTGRKLVSVGYRHGFCDVNDIAISPFDFLGYIKMADSVITSMFHGVMLSLVYRKPMALVIDPYRTNKLSTAMDSFALWEKVYSSGKIQSILEKNVDERIIDREIAKGRKESLEYLRGALNMSDRYDQQI